ncbi:MarR family winged helix-turn-helix transcriptional regulator [Mycolicibacterium rhodesiae]|uniref:MarR family transcriptional regulator n=1 Tax=Mycolicibacterium rhodesiae TaxID=36814 RepID=A0A1X0J332_MYCRH|nr:MarR family transcriptional regulator [Mycolicibacterium rhodesiae]MCV7348021.1 MarR family transcriptional regulator [Mycolicibacterium rhodesiae]ORB56128.1 MarR family transcriptional regulator [Mycolicibacterium rhodesiae]
MATVDESSIQAARDLRVVFSRLRRRLRAVATDDDLTPSETAVLLRLFKDGPSSTSELAGAERVRPQSMAATVAGLDRHGLIDRTPDPDDGRRQLIGLTNVGRRRAESDRKVRDEWLVRAMQDRYTEDERHVINNALTLLSRLDE